MSGQFIDAPAPKFIDAPAPGSTPPATGGLDLGGIAKKVGGVAQRVGGSIEGAATDAARNPPAALGNLLNTVGGGIAGAVMAPLQENVGNDVGKFLRAEGHGIVGGATNPAARDKYYSGLGDVEWNGIRAKDGWGRAAQDMVTQMALPTGIPAAGKLLKAVSKTAPARGIANATSRVTAPVAKYVNDVKEVAKDPKYRQAANVLSKGASVITSPVRGMVDASKDILFLDPSVHGVGNLGTLSFLKNGAKTAAKGLYYGLRGAPKGSADLLDRAGAAPWTPDLMEEGSKASPWGPVGLVQRLPGPTVAKAALGAAGGAETGYNWDPNADQGTRLKRAAEYGLLGGALGGSPALRTASNKAMTRLELGQRAAMAQKLLSELPQKVPGKPNLTAQGLKDLGAQINDTFGGGGKSAGAKLVSAAAGPFAEWMLDIVPRNVGGAIAKHPQRVRAITNTQSNVNNDVLKNQPYQMQVGGPVGTFSKMAFNPPGFAAGLLGPAAAIAGSKNTLTNPDSLNPVGQAKEWAQSMVPGGEQITPFFGDSPYKSKAPVGPSQALSDVVGWYLKNKTPATDAILGIMRSTGLPQNKAADLYYRYRR